MKMFSYASNGSFWDFIIIFSEKARNKEGNENLYVRAMESDSNEQAFLYEKFKEASESDTTKQNILSWDWFQIFRKSDNQVTKEVVVCVT